MRVLTAVVFVTLLTPLLAQEMPKPGPEHQLLKELVGTWDSTMKVEGKDSKGVMVYKMDLGGFWLVGTLESEMFGAKFTGKSIEGYDQAKKKFTSIWVDSMSSAPVLMQGTHDKDKNTLSMAGEGPGMDGKTVKYRSETKLGKDTMEMTMWIGDSKEPMFTIVYKRRK